MAARARANGRAPSAAAKRRQGQAAKAEAAQQRRQKELESQLENAHAWLRMVKGQRAELAEQKEMLEAQDAQLKDGQQQALGRVILLEEMLGRRVPLPDITQQAQVPPPAPDPTEAEAETA